MLSILFTSTATAAQDQKRIGSRQKWNKAIRSRFPNPVSSSLFFRSRNSRSDSKGFSLPALEIHLAPTPPPKKRNKSLPQQLYRRRTMSGQAQSSGHTLHSIRTHIHTCIHSFMLCQPRYILCFPWARRASAEGLLSSSWAGIEDAAACPVSALFWRNECSMYCGPV